MARLPRPDGTPGAAGAAMTVPAVLGGGLLWSHRSAFAVIGELQNRMRTPGTVRAGHDRLREELEARRSAEGELVDVTARLEEARARPNATLKILGEREGTKPGAALAGRREQLAARSREIEHQIRALGEDFANGVRDLASLLPEAAVPVAPQAGEPAS